MRGKISKRVLLGALSALALIGGGTLAYAQAAVSHAVGTKAASPTPGTPAPTVGSANVRFLGERVPTGNFKPAHQSINPFRPALSPGAFRAAKEAAAKLVAPRSGARGADTPIGSPPIVFRNCIGVNRTTAGGAFPPDTSGAVGLAHFVETTNVHFDVFRKSDCALLKSVSLNSFFVTTRALTDPEVLYDRVWNRWVVIVDQFKTVSTHINNIFFAVSTTSSPLGSFFLYDIGFTGFPGTAFWDFPHLGMDQDAVMITGNVFGLGGTCSPFCAEVFGIAKARAYNGLGFSFPVKNLGATFTVQPPVVLDQTPNDFLVGAAPSASSIRLFRCHDFELPSVTSCVFQANVSVPAYIAPADANDGTGTPFIDTSDSRFVNHSTEYTTLIAGVSRPVLWNAHTTGFSTTNAIPTPRFYEINAGTNALVQTGQFFVSGRSQDWNVSIVANNASNDAFVTWTSNNPATIPFTHTQVRTGGRQASDGLGAMRVGPALFTSGVGISDQIDQFGRRRWGDYSQVSLDPRPPSGCQAAWIVNEDILGTGTTWGSRVGGLEYCP